MRPYLSPMINNHKTQGDWKIHSGKTIIDHKTQKFHPYRASKIKLFIDQYNWKEIYFQPYKKGKNNEAIALNMLYVSYNTKEIRHSYKSKHNLTHKNQVILLMITDGKK